LFFLPEEVIMKKINFLIRMAGISLALAMTVIGCDTGTSSSGGGGGDTWSQITSVAQVVGTWKGSYRDTSTEASFSNLLPPGITSRVDVTLTSTIASTGVMTLSYGITATFSGTNIDQLWPSIKAEFGPGTNVNDSNYSMTYTENMTGSLGNSGGTLINQSGTKIKIPAGSLGEESSEVIMYRQ
jgi:hypothetical protein